MPKTLYLENTIVSYLTAKPSGNVHVRVHQETTQRWWRTRRKEFQLFVSPLVLEEAAVGDQIAARRRTRLLRRLPQVAVTDSVSRIAETLVDRGAIPRVAEVDAVHVALAAVRGLD